MGKKIKHTQCMEGIFCDVDHSVSQWGRSLFAVIIESVCKVSESYLYDFPKKELIYFYPRLKLNGYWIMIKMLLWNDFDNIVSSSLCCFKTTYQILPTPLRSCKKRINRASRHWILRTLVHTELELKSNNKNEVPGECFYTRQLCILLFKYKKNKWVEILSLVRFWLLNNFVFTKWFEKLSLGHLFSFCFTVVSRAKV